MLAKLEQSLREAEKLQGPLKEAYTKACDAALAVEGFVKEHPVFVTVIALGVLVMLTPWVLEVLGFAELGPVEGTPASLSCSRVPRPTYSDIIYTAPLT